MKNKTVLVLIAGLSTCLTLTGCFMDDLEDEEVLTEEELDEIDVEYNNIVADELCTAMMEGTATIDDLRELANIYAEQGLVAKRRDVLEQCYMMYGDVADLEVINSIWVNAEEESNAVKDAITLLYNNLDDGAMNGEAIGQITDKSFMSILKPGIHEGFRNYYLYNGNSTIALSVGYLENGTPLVKSWVTYNTGIIVSLSMENYVVKLVNANGVGSEYDGEFTQWILNQKNGDVTIETGSIKNGNLDGTYTAKLHKGDGVSDAMDLFNMKDELSYTTYTGSFDGTGATTTEKPNDQTKESLMKGTEYKDISVYAYNEKKTSVLFKGIEGDSKIYSIENWGINAVPSFDTYEVVTVDNANSDVQAKVVNGRLYVFDGIIWTDMGNVSALTAADPYAKTDEIDIPSIDSVAQGESNIRESGSVVEEKKQTTEKPATSKPTPAPAAPAPDPGPSSGGGDNGGGGGNTNPAPAPDPAPAPAPAPEPAPEPPASDDEPEVEANDGGWITVDD